MAKDEYTAWNRPWWHQVLRALLICIAGVGILVVILLAMAQAQ